MSALPLLVTYEARPRVVLAMGQELRLPDEELELALALLADGLPPLTRPEWLPFLFGISPKLIGAMSVKSGRYYRRFQIPKKSGGFRQIVTPRRFLKTVQRWILHRILSGLPQSDNVHGFVVGRGIFSNASQHLAGQNLLAVDIRNFFPSVTRETVKSLVSENFKFPEPVAAQLAGLCTLNGTLPQGAPTSPALANAAFLEADRKLVKLAGGWGATYTRYADDLAFSGPRLFTDEDVEAIGDIVSQEGFDLHDGKSRIVGAGGRQMVAGIVVNQSGFPPRHTRRRWRAMFHRAERFPHEFLGRSAYLSGVASFVNQYSSELAVDYFAIAETVRHLGEEGAPGGQS